MLKFVSTKPPRGRSPSGSMTPDRDVFIRQFPPPESSPRVPPLPRVPSSPKFGRRPQSYTYPSTRGGSITSRSIPPSYKTVHTSGGGNSDFPSRDFPSRDFPSRDFPSRDFPRLGEASSEFRSLRYPEQYYQQHTSKQQQQQQQQQTRQYPHPPLRQNLEPPWPFQNGFPDKTTIAARTEPNSHQSHPVSAAYSHSLGHPVYDNRFNYKARDRFSLSGESQNETSSIYDTNKARTLPKNAYIPIINRDSQSNQNRGDSTYQLRGIKEVNLASPGYVRHVAFRDTATPRLGSDYDLARPVMEAGDRQETSPVAGPKTTQFIVEESLTKRRLSETFIPPPASGATPYTVERLITEPGPPVVPRRLKHWQPSDAKVTGPVRHRELPVATQQ
ncbi:unnamed protein product, partial [Candidula unifasciata]